MNWLLHLAILLLLSSCFRTAPEESSGLSVDHSLFDSLLSKYVSDDGLVDYSGFVNEREVLAEYLAMLSSNVPSKGWSKDEKLAYWINAYNAFTIDLIITENPASSIKEITPVNVPFVVSPWQLDFIKLGGKEYNLDDIEHGIIRKEFDEPRIHFALVCAAYSCPPLRREAYNGKFLNRQLNEQTSRFLNDRQKNSISSDRFEISKIFDWYAEDFASEGGVVAFIDRYVERDIKENPTIEYKDYDWTLNSQSLHP